MTKRYLTLLFGVALSIAGIVGVYAQVSRSAQNESEPSASVRSESVRGIPLQVMPRIRTADASSASPFATMSRSAKTPMYRAEARRGARDVAQRANSKATALYGWRNYTNGPGDIGWMKLTMPTPTSLWKRVNNLQGNGGGFVRNGNLYTFYRYISDSYVTDAGLIISDFNTGATKSVQMFDLFSENPYMFVVWNAVYDEVNDVAYVVTSNTGGKGYILQKFNPETFEFTNLGVNVPEDWMAFAWHPGEGTIYMLDESCILKKYDSKGKKFVQAASFSYDITGYLCAMVYSPNDKAFVTMLDAYASADSYDEVTDVVLVTETGAKTYVTTLTDNDQWSMLYCPDAYTNPAGPAAPVLNSVNVLGEATSGTISVKLPSKYGNGNNISGNVYLQTQIDGASAGSDVSGAPGANVTVSISTTQGLHRITLTPYTLGDDGFNYGTPLVVNRFFGHDTPSAPTNVKLTDNKITWNAVTTGANDGFINPANVTYDVYIDGVKMNTSAVSGTSFTYSALPKTSAVGHIASVVAIENGNRSEEGKSAKYYSDEALNVPCFLGPDPGQDDMDPELISMFTIVRDAYTEPGSLRGWRYDDQSEHTGGFYCLYPSQTTDPERCDEWLFLPAINFDKADAYYRLAMDLWCGNHYFSGDEVYEVALCKRPTRQNPTIIREATTVYNNPNWETSETLFKVPSAGEWYIGVHYITNPQNSKIYRLYARNFRVEETNATASAPAQVTDLEAEASPRGALSAVVKFKMPTTDITGNTLSTSTQITATVSTTAGSVETTGAPGAACTVTVPAVQGENTVQVVSSSANGTGQLAETIVYCGVYRPGTALADPVVSQDNSTMTLNIDIDEYNENDEYTGGDACDAIIYRRIGDEWRQVENIGTKRQWTFAVEPNAAMDLYQFGVAAKNVVGTSEELTTFGVVLGKPYELPMEDDFLGSEYLKYEPMTIEHISYLPGTWGFDDPANWNEAAANESGIALIAMWESITQLSLPKFTTLNKTNVKMDLSLFFGDKSAKLVTVYASSPSVTMEPIATFNRKSGNGWEHKIISLPASCQNQGWVEIKIRAEIEGYSEYFMMDYFAIGEYPEDMVTITGMHSDTRAQVGDTKTVTVELTNAGTQDKALPGYEMTLIGDNGIIGNLTAVNPPATIPTGKPATLTFEYTPKAADMGDVLLRFSLNDKNEMATTEMERYMTVYNAAIPIVNNLTAWLGGEKDEVHLDWSTPTYTETFETFEPWDYSENLRDFINLDRDGRKVWGITEAAFNGKGVAKGFQVFSSTITDNPILAAHSGDQMLLAMSTTSGETDDWLISPQIKGGSKLSFWMNVLDPEFPETIMVMASSTGTDPDDFTMVEGGYICPDEREWRQYTFTLPANAKYFALWHYGDDGSEQFGCMIDDITYEAAKPKAKTEGFNLYRDDALIGEGLTGNSFIDYIKVSSPMRYYVKTIATVNGERMESDRSNVLWVDSATAAIESAAANDAQAAIRGGDARIEFYGFNNGSAVQIFTLNGILVANATINGNPGTVSVPAGIYVAKCGSRIAKVVVK